MRLAGDLSVAGRALPGQLDPAPDAPPRRGRRLLRRRQRRPLPADDRRGHPHRALLRPGLRARAARASSRAARTRAQALARYARVLRRATPAVPLAAAGAAPRRRASNPTPRDDAGAAARWTASGSSTGRSATTSRIAPPAFALEGESAAPCGAREPLRGGPRSARSRHDEHDARPRAARSRASLAAVAGGLLVAASRPKRGSRRPSSSASGARRSPAVTPHRAERPDRRRCRRSSLTRRRAGRPTKIVHGTPLAIGERLRRCPAEAAATRRTVASGRRGRARWEARLPGLPRSRA